MTIFLSALLKLLFKTNKISILKCLLYCVSWWGKCTQSTFAFFMSCSSFHLFIIFIFILSTNCISIFYSVYISIFINSLSSYCQSFQNFWLFHCVPSTMEFMLQFIIFFSLIWVFCLEFDFTIIVTWRGLGMSGAYNFTELAYHFLDLAI